MARNWTAASDEEFARQNETAVREAADADRVEPRARSVSYDAERGVVMVTLTSGLVFGFPPGRATGLERATPEQLAAARISPSGDGLHWDELDAHLSLTGLMADVLNLREWAPRLMGQIRSDAKARAARENGLKGGRPRKPGARPKPPPSTAAPKLR